MSVRFFSASLMSLLMESMPSSIRSNCSVRNTSFTVDGFTVLEQQLAFPPINQSSRQVWGDSLRVRLTYDFKHKLQNYSCCFQWPTVQQWIQQPIEVVSDAGGSRTDWTKTLKEWTNINWLPPCSSSMTKALIPASLLCRENHINMTDHMKTRRVMSVYGHLFLRLFVFSKSELITSQHPSCLTTFAETSHFLSWKHRCEDNMITRMRVVLSR